MKKERVIVIGAGLGGLECGYILAKNGMQVTVLEHEGQVGGCLQTFRRGAALFRYLMKFNFFSKRFKK